MKKKILILLICFSCFFAINCFASDYSYLETDETIKSKLGDYSDYIGYIVCNGPNNVLYAIVFGAQTQTDLNSLYVTINKSDTDRVDFTANDNSVKYMLISGNEASGLNNYYGSNFVTSSGKYVSCFRYKNTLDGNINIYNTDGTVFFQAPPVEAITLEEILKSEPQTIPTKIMTILQIVIAPILVAYSMLLLVYLIKYLVFLRGC